MKHYQIYINGTKIRRVYSKNRAIDLAQKWCGCLFENQKTEVIDTTTGEVIYQIN